MRRAITFSGALLAAGLLVVAGTGSARAERQWTETPVDFRTNDAAFFDVVAVSGRNIWAAGHDDQAQSSLVAHWDGKRWTRVDVPAVRRVNALAGDGSDIWAAGDDGVLRWDGDTWTKRSAGQGGSGRSLSGIAPEPGTDRLWAVGTEQTGAFETRGQILRWDGASWTSVDVGIDARDWGLAAVHSNAPDDAWAVGHIQPTASTPTRPLALHWNGRSWRQVRTPSVPGEVPVLSSVLAVDTDDVWAVGDSVGDSSPLHPVAMHWDGAKWSIVETPNDNASLVDVGRTPGGPIAVGLHDETWEAYVLEYRDGAWVKGTPPPSKFTLFGVGTDPRGRAWVAGASQSPSGAGVPAAARRSP